MTRTERLSRAFTAAVLSGGLAIAGFGIAAGVAQLTGDTTITAFNPQPEPPTRPGRIDPGGRVGFDPQPDPPGSTRGFDPQPEPPTGGIAVGR